MSSDPNLDSMSDELVNADSMLHVSLGVGTDAATAAPSQSADAPLEAIDSENTPPKQLGSLFQLIRVVAAAESRDDAVKELTVWIAERFSGATVRCGLGMHEEDSTRMNATRLKRLFDHRLGWLAPESSPMAIAVERWSRAPLSNTGIVFDDDTMMIVLARRESSERCVIWIEPVSAELLCEGNTSRESIVTQWLQTIDETLSTVFWSRPKRTTPKAIKKLTRPSAAILGSILLGLCLLAFWPVHYRVSCLARVQPTGQRLVAAPFEATLKIAHVKPGQNISKGDVLVSLDGRPLRIERESIEAEIAQASKEHDTSLAQGKIAEAQQAKLRERQLGRRWDLISDRLNRLEVVSPIDGIIISGDLSQYEGAPLELGQTLLEISPMEKMALEIEIPAHEIGYVEKDSETRVRFSSIGGPSMELNLKELYPSAEIREDQNVFIGRIEIDNVDNSLRPGMVGDATTYGPIRPWIWSWIRGGVERVLWWCGY